MIYDKYLNFKKEINKIFYNHPGEVDNFWLPTTHSEAIKWLDYFIVKKFNCFIVSNVTKDFCSH